MARNASSHKRPSGPPPPTGNLIGGEFIIDPPSFRYGILKSQLSVPPRRWQIAQSPNPLGEMSFEAWLAQCVSNGAPDSTDETEGDWGATANVGSNYSACRLQIETGWSGWTEIHAAE